MNKNGIQINKVKYLEKQENIIVTYDHTIDNHVSHHVTTFDEQPAPEFFDALDGLTRPCCSIFDLDEKYIERLRPYGVTFHYDGDGNMGATISCKLDIPSSNTCIAINTPSKRCPQDEVDAQDSTGFFSDTMVKSLWEFESEVRKYLDGKRNQISLFGEEQEPCEAAESPVRNENEQHEETHEEVVIPPAEAIQGNVVGFPTHNAAAAR